MYKTNSHGISSGGKGFRIFGRGLSREKRFRKIVDIDYSRGMLEEARKLTLEEFGEAKNYKMR